ncbi:hypothetical protein [Paenibacillus sp. QZ-Y1]|uniref:hypothetical protein n=1 Tax=Paenibacillus sp. QZ-Y1 TaxID=3414511 RepID=UPI003F7A60DD
MRKTDYMSKWKMGIGSAFLMVMLAGCGSGVQDLASGSGDFSFVNLEAGADSSSDQTRNQDISEGSTVNNGQEQQQAKGVLKTEI